MAISAPHRFVVLDGLRGLAAIIIVQRHTNWWPVGWHFASGYLAVDFFFMLSGFVIAHAYRQKLEAGMPVARFLGARLSRLYPLYFLALIGVVFLASAHHQDLSIWTILLSVVLLPSLLRVKVAWLVSVSWSLAAELGANTIYSWCTRHITIPRLAVVTAISAAALIATAVQFQSLDGGWEGPTIWVGVARVAFSFSTGLLIHDLLPRLERLSAPWPLCILVLGLLLATSPPAGSARIVADLLIVLVAMPTLLIAAANSRPGRLVTPALLWLGEISYGLYILQEPLRDLIDTISGLLGLDDTTPLVTIGAMAAMLLAATLITRYVDAPFRHWLASASRPSQRQATGPTN